MCRSPELPNEPHLLPEAIRGLLCFVPHGNVACLPRRNGWRGLKRASSAWRKSARLQTQTGGGTRTVDWATTHLAPLLGTTRLWTNPAPDGVGFIVRESFSAQVLVVCDTGHKALCPVSRQDREGIMLTMAGHTMGSGSVILYAMHTIPGRFEPHNHCACTMYK